MPIPFNILLDHKLNNLSIEINKNIGEIFADLGKNISVDGRDRLS
jgi:hypothetical protein